MNSENVRFFSSWTRILTHAFALSRSASTNKFMRVTQAIYEPLDKYTHTKIYICITKKNKNAILRIIFPPRRVLFSQAAKIESLCVCFFFIHTHTCTVFKWLHMHKQLIAFVTISRCVLIWSWYIILSHIFVSYVLRSDFFFWFSKYFLVQLQNRCNNNSWNTWNWHTHTQLNRIELNDCKK